MTVLRDYASALSQPALVGSGPTGAEPGVDAEPARYDEVVGPDGALRPAWKAIGATAVTLTPGDLRRVDGDIAAMLADDGVTYARAGEGVGPWQLDPVPLVIDAAEWTPLEVGLAQRAELLNAVLADLYGEQRLLSHGVVPAAVVLGHPGFTRAVARPASFDPRPLVLSAADLGRDAAGRWCVLADRAQAPSGMGYAMENRRVISKALPELYREAGLHRLAPFLAALRSALLQSAQGDLADPRVVVLTPGTLSETAYDQAFLASALGFPLVQGSDLAVRDGWVWLLQQGRRERVDVILRRVDAAYSDPLELRGDSRLGVAGLTEAVRRGRVRVVNGLGAGVLENPALLPYLPAACEALLGEPLRLASVPTWWCGDPQVLERVLGWLDARGRGGAPRLLVRTVDGTLVRTSGSAASVRSARERLLDEPHRHVAQERLPLSQAPTWGAAGRTVGIARPKPVRLRTFTLRFGSAYRPMLGGLAHVVEPGPAGDLSGASKDVWVLKGAAGDLDQGLPDVLPMTAGRAASVLVPRVLEDMFWFGRYAERVEDMLRLVLTAHALAEDFRTRPRSAGGASLDVVMGAVHGLAGPHDGGLDADFRSLLLDPDRVGGAAHAMRALRVSLGGVRDQLSADTWRAFGTIDRATATLAGSAHSHQVAESSSRMLTGVLALQGVTASMIRDAGWHMMGAGRSLERALQLCHLLARTTVIRRGIDVDRDVLNAVLTATESAVTHRRRYRGYVRPAGVLEMLLLDPDNPRSLAFSLTEAQAHLAAQHGSTGSTQPERLLADLRADVQGTEVATLLPIGGVSRPNLQVFLDATIRALDRIGSGVTEVHLTSGPGPQPLSTATLVEVSAGQQAPLPGAVG